MPKYQRSRIKDAVARIGLPEAVEADVLALATEMVEDRTRLNAQSARSLAWIAVGQVRRFRISQGHEDILWELRVPGLVGSTEGGDL